VAEGVAAHRGAWSRHDAADELPSDLAAVSGADAEAQHGDVRADVRDREGLAEDVGPLEVAAFDGHISDGPGLAGGSHLLCPGPADGGGVLGLGLLGERGHRWFLSLGTGVVSPGWSWSR